MTTLVNSGALERMVNLMPECADAGLERVHQALGETGLCLSLSPIAGETAQVWRGPDTEVEDSRVDFPSHLSAVSFLVYPQH